MFRKKTKKASAKKNLRRKRSSEEEEDETDTNDDTASATAIAIRTTLKKQKILASLPMTSVGGGRASKASFFVDNSKTDPNENSNEEVVLSVMETKHKNNMEAFIEQQMRSKDSKSDAKAPYLDTTTEDSKTKTTSEEDLYRELAREVTNTSDNPESQSIQQEQNQLPTEDQGSGGAALLGGTGIAEVLLPATKHESLAANPTKVRNKFQQNLSSAVPEGDMHRQILPETTPQPFVKFQQPRIYPNPIQKDDLGNEKDPSDGDRETTTELSNTNGDGERQGFDAYRGKAAAFDQNGGGPKDKDAKWKQNRDDRAFRNFRDKALGNRNIL